MKSESTTYSVSLYALIRRKAQAFAKLTKFRLTMLVVISAVFGFLMAPSVTGMGGIAYVAGIPLPIDLLLVALGGFLLTSASNTLNQVLEVEFDKLMSRTKQRPMPTGDLSVTEALVFAGLAGVGGVLILGLMFNLITALLGIIALLSYAFVYTPLKRVGSISVFVGAIPGALPPMIGVAAATGEIGTVAIILFLIQFFWQFPHFWAIAWVLDEDYGKAGFKLLPSRTGRTPFTASIILMYTAILIPIVFVPWQLGMTGWLSLSTLLLGGGMFTWLAYRLLKQLDTKAAKKLMFFSFIYLPLVQITLLIDKFQWI